ncbi:sugar ABC transporter permease [Nocardioides sp. J54]|uniref:sugar ABC transporter permease n=1 Tax=Nocardioides sp. J54 TaxID=935866 RepID=UPI00048BC3A8|nr:ABC transporter permease [Nocardioides sp. J54]
MTTETPETRPASATYADADFAQDSHRAGTLREAARDYLNRVRGGDMGSLPALLGLLVLFVIFGLTTDSFFTNLNLANLTVQAAPICVLAMALVPVLLIGEIDLSAGVASGTGAAITALAIVDHGQPWPVAVVAGIACGAVIGLAIGAMVARLGIPSFVVTLSFFLALQGVMLRLIGQGGSVRFNHEVLRGLAIKNVPVTLGWICAVAIVAAYAALALFTYRRQVARDLARPPFGLVVLRIAVLAVVVLGLTAYFNVNRSRNPFFPIEGVPYMVPVVVVILLLMTFLLSRTAFGRHLYAVGGNREAARRAGINVLYMRIMAFVLCSSLAAVAGILQAAYSGKVSPGSGGGNVLLYAVGAAVIGGTSLFGGRGRAIDGVIGGVVLATVDNGLPLLIDKSYANYLVTGGVLLLAASVDAISRRRRSATGV